MSLKSQHVIAVAAFLALGSGCMLFPASFDGDEESAEGGATADATLADHCIEGVPTWSSGHQPRLVSFDGLTDDISDLNTCGLAGARTSAEGFFAIEAEQGQRWHFMARPMDEFADVAVEVFSTCDERTCLRAQASCSHGHAEHINFIAETAGTYLVSVESDMGGEVEILATSPACGDGMLQHGEGCDDGNREDLDGCTARCQVELLTARETESEPNNERFEANIIRWAGEHDRHIELTGQLGGACDIDTYEFEVPEGASIHAEMLDAQNSVCDSGIPPVVLELIDTRDYTVRGTISADGNCVVLDDSAGFASGLPAGTYQLRIQAPHLDEGHDDGATGETGDDHSDTTGGHGDTGGDHGGTTGGHGEESGGHGEESGGHGETGHSEPTRTTAGEPEHGETGHGEESGGHGEDGGHSGETGGAADGGDGGHDGHGGGPGVEGDPDLFVYHLHIRVGAEH